MVAAATRKRLWHAGESCSIGCRTIRRPGSRRSTTRSSASPAATRRAPRRLGAVPDPAPGAGSGGVAGQIPRPGGASQVSPPRPGHRQAPGDARADRRKHGSKIDVADDAVALTLGYGLLAARADARPVGRRGGRLLRRGRLCRRDDGRRPGRGCRGGRGGTGGCDRRRRCCRRARWCACGCRGRSRRARWCACGCRGSGGRDCRRGCWCRGCGPGRRGRGGRRHRGDGCSRPGGHGGGDRGKRRGRRPGGWGGGCRGGGCGVAGPVVPLAELDRVHPQPDHIAVVQDRPAVDAHVVDPRAAARVVILEREPPVGLPQDPRVLHLDVVVAAGHERERGVFGAAQHGLRVGEDELAARAVAVQAP